MHIRIRPWAQKELDECEYFIKDPLTMKGKWTDCFSKKQPLHIELGCGKCVSTCKMAHEQQNINFIAIDVISMILGMGRRFIAEEYGKDPIDNLFLTRFNILNFSEYFSENDKADRIYISFCNPWERKKKQHKRRLTHPRQLEQYKTVMKPESEIWFKTDNDALWLDSLDYFRECGFDIVYKTEDLHASGFTPNYYTEHEIKFTEQNIPIKFLIAKL